MAAWPSGPPQWGGDGPGRSRGGANAPKHRGLRPAREWPNAERSYAEPQTSSRPWRDLPALAAVTGYPSFFNLPENYIVGGKIHFLVRLPFKNHFAIINSDDTPTRTNGQYRVSVAVFCHRIDQHASADPHCSLQIVRPRGARCAGCNNPAYVVAAAAGRSRT